MCAGYRSGSKAGLRTFFTGLVRVARSQRYFHRGCWAAARPMIDCGRIPCARAPTGPRRPGSGPGLRRGCASRLPPALDADRVADCKPLACAQVGERAAPRPTASGRASVRPMRERRSMRCVPARPGRGRDRRSRHPEVGSGRGWRRRRSAAAATRAGPQHLHRHRQEDCSSARRHRRSAGRCGLRPTGALPCGQVGLDLVLQGASFRRGSSCAHAAPRTRRPGCGAAARPRAAKRMHTAALSGIVENAKARAPQGASHAEQTARKHSDLFTDRHFRWCVRAAERCIEMGPQRPPLSGSCSPGPLPTMHATSPCRSAPC